MKVISSPNLKLLAGFDAVGQAPKLSYEFFLGINFLDVAFWFHGL